MRDLDPDLPLYDLQRVDATLHEATWFFSVFGSVFVVFGLAALFMAAGVSRVVEVLMFQVSARDPLVFGGVVVLIVAVGLVASLVPARRATRVDPMVALRGE